MAMYSSLISVLTLMLQIQLYPGDATIITIENKCDNTVWPVIDTTNGASLNTSITKGFALNRGESRTINIQTSWRGRLWGRTFCKTDSLTKNFSCQTGDCGSGKMDCMGASYQHPVTLIEFSTSNSGNAPDFYDTSVVDGYNLPVAVAPQDRSGSGCGVTGCVFNIHGGCPDELKVMDRNQSIIGCNSPCNVFHTNESCCSTSDDCKRDSFSLGSLIFKKACPRAYSYALDDATSTFTCSGIQTSYIITFCPSPSLARCIRLTSVASSFILHIVSTFHEKIVGYMEQIYAQYLKRRKGNCNLFQHTL